MKNSYKFKDKTLYELKKTWPVLFLIIAAIVAFGDVSQIMMQLYTLSMTMFVLLSLYIVRRWMFPSISLTELAKSAQRSAIGSAIIYAAIIFFMVMLLIISVGKT